VVPKPPGHRGQRSGRWMGQARDRQTGCPRVEWFWTKNPDGTVTERVLPLPRSSANVKREFSEKKWQDAKGWAREKLARTSNRKYRPSDRQKPDATVARANKRLASRFCQLKTGHCLTGQDLAWTTRRPDATCWWCQYKTQTREHLFKNCPQWKSQQRTLGQPSSKSPASSPAYPGPGPHQHRGAARRRAVQSGGARVSSNNRRRSDVRPTGGR